MTETLKLMIKSFFKTCTAVEPINDLSAYYKAKRWVIKVCILYTVFSVIAIAVISFMLSAASYMASLTETPTSIFFVAIPLIFLTCWGYAMLILYAPQIFKSVIKFGSTGYHIGEKIETTSVKVTHEFGNSYRVSSSTENKGCLFAVIAGMIRFFVWAFFCVYIAPFLTLKKLIKTINSIKGYPRDLSE